MHKSGFLKPPFWNGNMSFKLCPSLFAFSLIYYDTFHPDITSASCHYFIPQFDNTLYETNILNTIPMLNYGHNRIAMFYLEGTVAFIYIIETPRILLKVFVIGAWSVYVFYFILKSDGGNVQ